MDLLCIAALSPKKGFVLLNGINPSTEDLVRIIGGTVEGVDAAIAELERWGVFSRDRAGVIYCRRMVREQKKKRASAKGGRIGGRVTYEKNKGIFATQGNTQGAARPPTHPIPTQEINNGVTSKGNGSGRDGVYTIQNADDRIARFTQKLVAKLPSADGWLIVAAAMDDSSPNHATALRQCQAAARAIGKGWPRNWPTARRTN